MPANDARQNFRLPMELKQILDQESITRLSDYDRDVFVPLLDETEACPNEALTAASGKYKSDRE